MLNCGDSRWTAQINGLSCRANTSCCKALSNRLASDFAQLFVYVGTAALSNAALFSSKSCPEMIACVQQAAYSEQVVEMDAQLRSEVTFQITHSLRYDYTLQPPQLQDSHTLQATTIAASHELCGTDSAVTEQNRRNGE